MKKTQEIFTLRAKDQKALFLELRESRGKLLELSFKASFRKLKNYREIRTLRRHIAKIWTILSEKAILAEEKEIQNEKK